MAMKRGRTHMDEQEGGDDDASARGKHFNPKRRKHFVGSSSSKHKPKDGTLEFSRKRIRNIERLLRRKNDLPADVQNDLQRELASHQANVSDRSFQKKRSAMITKYHMVRFFERKKASRLIKQLRTQMEQNPGADDTQHLKHQLHIAEVDEAYTIYHPHLEPYISLYGSSKGNEGREEDGEGDGEKIREARSCPAAKASLAAKKPPLWHVVEEAMMGQGIEALKRLQERKPAGEDAPGPGASHDAARKSGNRLKGRSEKQADAVQAKHRTVTQDGHEMAAQLNRRERRRLMRETMPADDADEQEEGGGFFEEL